MSQIIVALDTGEIREAVNWITILEHSVKWFKIGMQLFTAAGPQLVDQIKCKGLNVFLDLKFYDIPNTVGGAVKSACELGVDMLTLHCQGGERMCKTAIEAAANFPVPPLLIGVTVLTSFASGELPGIDLPPNEFGLLLARKANEWGLNGIVCSGQEVAEIKENLPDLIYVCPGIRLDNSISDDQRRIITPKKAIRDGANFLVLGRAITKAKNPLKTLHDVMAEIDGLENL